MDTSIRLIPFFKRGQDFVFSIRILLTVQLIIQYVTIFLDLFFWRQSKLYNLLNSQTNRQSLSQHWQAINCSLKKDNNGSDVVTALSFCLLAQSLHEQPHQLLPPHVLMLFSQLLVHCPDLFTAEGLEQTITAQQQQLIMLFFVRGNIRNGADHPWQSPVLPELDFCVSDSAGHVQVARQDAHLPEKLYLVDNPLLLSVDLPSVLYYPQLLSSLVRFMVPCQLQRIPTSTPEHQSSAITQVCYDHLRSHYQTYNCA